MEQTIIRKLKDGTLAPYRALAKKNGRSLEAELRDLLERSSPDVPKDAAELVALARQLQAETLKPGSDSTPYIRWCRDTNAGRLPGSRPFRDDDAGR